ncbi:DUF6182 family protein [Streptomyces sp. NPDC020983]|uniref:DUF6182 family protein n=1 Tax=Streptomyces sp. NPDC020983 TaxID=3365106 RepID=UPI0037B5C06F
MTPVGTAGVLGQEELRRAAAARLHRARPDLLDGADADLERLLRAADALAEEDERDPRSAHAVAVVRSYAPARWVAQACAFGLSLQSRPDAERVAAWRRSLTRTVFLAGDPRRLQRRFDFHHLSPDGSVAWCAPGPPAATAPLRRLLKTLRASGGAPAIPPTPVRVPDAARPARRAPLRRQLYVATARTPLPRLLVHTHHLLVEAVLDGLVEPGDRLVLHHVPSLGGLRAHFDALRVDAEEPPSHGTSAPPRLRAWAALTRGERL